MSVVSYLCAYQGCNNNKKKDKGVSFFKFPSKSEIHLTEWKKNCGNIQIYDMDAEELKNKVICEKHFLSEYVIEQNKRKLLRKNAVPLLYSEQGKYHK